MHLKSRLIFVILRTAVTDHVFCCMCAACHMLEEEKCENVSLRKLVELLKQQMQETKTLLCTDTMHLESSVTDEQQQQQLAGH